jgi:hypothetical protein
MDEIAIQQVRKLVDNLYRIESRRVFATLIRLLGDFDLAEEGGTARCFCGGDRAVDAGRYTQKSTLVADFNRSL